MASLKSLTLTLSNARATGLIVVMLLEELISIVDAFTRWLGRHQIRSRRNGCPSWQAAIPSKPTSYSASQRSHRLRIGQPRHEVFVQTKIFTLSARGPTRGSSRLRDFQADMRCCRTTTAATFLEIRIYINAILSVPRIDIMHLRNRRDL